MGLLGLEKTHVKANRKSRSAAAFPGRRPPVRSLQTPSPLPAADRRHLAAIALINLAAGENISKEQLAAPSRAPQVSGLASSAFLHSEGGAAIHTPRPRRKVLAFEPDSVRSGGSRVMSYSELLYSCYERLSPKEPLFRSLKTRCIAFSAISLLLAVLPAMAQPGENVTSAFQDELQARRTGQPVGAFGKPGPALEGKIVKGTLNTPDGKSYDFTSEAGAMVYVTNLETGQDFSFIVSPNLHDANATTPKNADPQSNFFVQAFRLEGGVDVKETQFTALNTRNGETFKDEDALGGSGSELFITGILSVKYDGGSSHSLCCVSCGTYQICGQTVESSCGSCGGGGVNPQIKG